MLPLDLIHKILSFTSIKSVIQTSALSSRWRSIWTSMPYLNLSTGDVPRFSELINHVLSARNDQIDIYSVDLCFVLGTFNDALLKRLLEYAFSHNVQRLTVTCLFGEKIDLPLSQLFCSQSLRYLSLTGSDTGFLDAYSIVLASTLELPALTTLHLDYVTFYEDNGVGPFSKCVNLKNLTLSHFMVLKSRSLTLCHPRISNLILENGHWTLDAVNVDAPQLKSLTISYCRGMHQITASNLASLLFDGSCLLKFSTDLPSLEKVGLCIRSPDVWRPYKIARLLHQLRNAKFLKLNLEFLEPLISCMERISPQPSPFCNLKSLKVYPDYVPLDDETHERVNLSTKVINYLLDGSPGATFTLISYEEIREKKQKA
ncbi:F-box/LRR-repeat protein At3g26922-like [Bidens hawaiensis]|uniref:F-box/LRR-repeat protein At3g26922-like n=1 Tax=Bidens hawaiensis TaxID=980011 RepID=UPI004049AA6F